jgi:hypothetical protein
MSIQWESSVVVDRPNDDVWAFLTDFFNAPRLIGGGMLGLRQTSPGPLGVGSTLQGRMVILGFETRINYRITEWDPPHIVASLCEARPLRSLSARLTLEPTAIGIRIDGSIEIELRPALKLIWPIVGPYYLRRWRAAFQELKGLIEAKPG